jgi:hypothetical protein
VNDSGFITTLALDGLTDVDTTTTAPTSGQALVWDGTNWVPGTISGGGGGSVTSVFGRTGDVVADAADYASFYATTTQGGLADTSVQPGDNISLLVNDSGFITTLALDGLSDVTITTPIDEHKIKFMGGVWINTDSLVIDGGTY